MPVLGWIYRMAKIVLENATSGFRSTTASNANNDLIVAEFQDRVLYRDNPPGEPNHMENNLDMNSNRILNLPSPISGSEPARWQDVVNGVYAIDAELLPSPEGNEGKYISTDGETLVYRDAMLTVQDITALRNLDTTTVYSTQSVYVASAVTNGTFTLVNSTAHGLVDNDFDIIVINDNWYATRIPQMHERLRRRTVRLDEIQARIANDERVVFVCYGDSTTDGYGTTGFVANSTSGGGVPNGTVDHNSQAQYAWPNILGTMMAYLYSADNTAGIDVYNLGYSGKSIADGWAVENYVAALTNPAYSYEDNAPYGTYPQVAFIQFGINDAGLGSGSELEDFVTNTEELIKIMLNHGTLPILLSTDPIMLNGTGSILDKREIAYQLDQCKPTIAAKYHIPYFDIKQDMLDFLETNNEMVAFGMEQTDSLHFGDLLQSFKAGAIARHLCPFIVNFSGGDRIISAWSPANRNLGNSYNRFTDSNTRQGGNIFWSGDAPTGQAAMTTFIWNTNPNAYLVYNGLVNENVDRITGITRPSVFTLTLSKEFAEGTLGTTKEIQSAGLYHPNNSYRASDSPYIFGKLPYGLTMVQYIVGSYTSAFYGCFRIIEGTDTLHSDALAEHKRFTRTFTTSTGVYTEVVPPAKNLANIASAGFAGESIVIRFKGYFPDASGFIALYGQGFNGTTDATVYNQQNGILLYRRPDDYWVLYNTMWDKAGHNFQYYDELAVSAAPFAFPVNHEFQGRIEIGLGTTQEIPPSTGIFVNRQRIRLYDAYVGGSALIDVTLYDDWCRFAGYVGGIFYNSDVGAATATVTLEEVLIERPTWAVNT